MFWVNFSGFGVNFVLKNVDVPMLFWAKLKKNICIGITAEWLFCFFFLAVYVIFDLALYEFFGVFAGYNI